METQLSYVAAVEEDNADGAGATGSSVIHVALTAAGVWSSAAGPARGVAGDKDDSSVTVPPSSDASPPDAGSRRGDSASESPAAVGAGWSDDDDDDAAVE